MRKLWLALFLALFFIPAIVQLYTPAKAQQSVFVPATMATFSTAGNTTTILKIISGITGKSIYITAVGFHPAATSVLTLTQGTGTNCGTGASVLYGPATFQASENWYQGTGNGAIIALTSGNDLCITIGTASAPGFISYAQF